MMGFLGYLVPTGKNSPAHLVQALLPKIQNNKAQNLVAESEQYLTSLFAKLNFAISSSESIDNPASHPRKTNETVPVLANLSVVPLLFCFPESSGSETFNSIITHNRFNLKTYFSTVEEIPIKAAATATWEAKLARVLMRQQPVVLIGVNLTDLRESDGNLHLYFSMPARWQNVFLPQIMNRVSTNLNTFRLKKQRLGTGEVFELIWKETTGDHLTNLDQNLTSIIQILGQIQASQAHTGAAKKI